MFKSFLSRLLPSVTAPSLNDMQTTHTDLNVEKLEHRRMLAGQVRVNVAGDNITIIGDNELQDVVVLASSGFVRVAVGPDTGLVGDVDDNGLTTVPDDQLRNLTIRLKGGNDSVAINSVLPAPESASLGGGLEVSGNLRVITGGGHDFVTFGPVQVARNTFVLTGAGNDTTVVSGSTFERNFIFRGAGGEDELRLGTGSQTAFNGNLLNVKMGASNDTLLVLNVVTDASTSVLWHGNGGGMDARNDFDPGDATLRSFEIVIV